MVGRKRGGKRKGDGVDGQGTKETETGRGQAKFVA